MLTLICWDCKYYLRTTKATMNIINRAIRNIATLIQIGDSTHHHDQLITPVNFRTTNTTVNTSEIPIDTEFSVLLIFILR